jgi:hypothetical protein
MINNDLRVMVYIWIDDYTAIEKYLAPSETMALIEFLSMTNIHHESQKYRMAGFHTRIEMGQVQLNISMKPIDSYKED